MHLKVTQINSRNRTRSGADRIGLTVAHFNFSRSIVSSRAPDDTFDRRVQRLDDSEAQGMITIGGNAVKMLDQDVGQLFHFREPLPPQRLEPAEEERGDTLTSLIGPEAIEFLSQHVGFEQAQI